MKEDKDLVNISLSSLIEKFSQENVIQQLEKEYQTIPSRLIPTSLISDTSFIKEVLIPEETINYFAEEISEKGIYTPLLVRPLNQGFEMILGRKRLFAAKKLGIVSMPCVVASITDEQLLLMLLADTRDQRDGNVVEMSIVYNELSSKFNYSQKTLAEISHQSRSQVTNLMRISKLPSFVREDICLGKLSYGHAKVLVSVEQALLPTLIKEIYDNKMSVRETERYIRNIRKNVDYNSLDKSYSIRKEDYQIVINFNDKDYLDDKFAEICKLLDKK